MSAFEMFDAKSYEYVRKHQEEAGHVKKVFETEGDFYCLIETGGSNADHDEEVRLSTPRIKSSEISPLTGSRKCRALSNTSCRMRWS